MGILPIVEPAVFLDRDNTLIANDADLGDPEHVRLIDGVAEGLKALHGAGFRLVVVTNQGGVARGHFSENDVDAVHQRIAMLVDESTNAEGLIDRFYYCPYHPEATIEEYRREHPWRKPQPGMLLQAARDMNLDLANCWVIGDRVRDITAGSSAGCRTALISDDADLIDQSQPTVSVRTFSEAVRAILSGAMKFDETDLGIASAPPEPKNSAPGAATSQRRVESGSQTPLADLRRAIVDLTEEVRNERLRRTEFTGLRLAAGLCQLFALLLALLGLLQLESTDVFIRWMIGAALVQLLTISVLLLDMKG